MEAEVWKKVEELFRAAQALPPERRAEFLEQACPDDAQIRAEVQSLLDATPSAESFLESSPIASALTAGAKLGHFEILGLLGRGGMGEVYRARDSRLRRDVAIKVLPLSFARDPDRIARFEREARAASALNHPNIVAVHDIGHENSTYWIVSELIDGQTLRRTIDRGPLAARKAIEIGVQIAEGLAAAHTGGIVHRDLKPGNIMVTHSGRVKILDFGLAKREHLPADSSTRELTTEGTVLGTAGYMSPEQVRGEDVDYRSDMFSFGVILYEMLAGKQAFSGRSSIEVMNAILQDDPPELPPSVPPGLERIVRRCLEKQAARRFQSAADLGFALTSVSSSQTASIVAPSRTWLKLATVGVASIAIAGVTYWLGMRTAGPSVPAETTLRRLTNDPGLTTGAAISPDGKLVAYASDRADSSNLDIWVQQVDGDGVVRVTDDPADDYDPTFSPDATQIAFRSDRKGGGIYVVSALGGEARLAIPQGRRPRFSPDGQRLMYWTGPDQPADVRGSSDTKVWVRPIAGGEATQIGAGCRLFAGTPVWSPDGSRILFVGTCGSDIVTRGSQPENYGLTAWVDALDGKSLKPNRELYGLWRSIHRDPVIDQWIANPSRLLIHLPVGDATSITAVPVSADGTGISGPPQKLTFAGGNAARLSAALNGRIALSSETSEPHIWTLPIDTKGAAISPPKQVTSGPAGELFPSLSADGEKLAFLSERANGTRLFYRDLVTGREKEVSTEGYRYGTPVFNHDGTKIMCVQYPNAASWRDFIFEVPISGGLSRKVWDQAAWTWLWDWSPDDSTLLIQGWAQNKPRRVDELDLKSGTASAFLDDPENLEQAHLSHDGRWVAFGSAPRAEFIAKPSRCSVLIAPFRKGLVPRSEWISVSDNNLDFDPRFSYDGKLIFFTSERDGFRCVWAQRLRPDMHPDGDAFAVYHSHERKRPLVVYAELAVGPHAMVLNRTELAGNVWLLEPAKHNTR